MDQVVIVGSILFAGLVLTVGTRFGRGQMTALRQRGARAAGIRKICAVHHAQALIEP
ncbi:hypothetical protein [Amycolatopsis sp. lyj-112]|uniref:hypothetical protein n=1 Tax=Amycolatopsis sp. lyj-112 TaxID=2789288 RepID=UPI00397A238E